MSAHIKKNCMNCGAWEPPEAHGMMAKGECRFKSPNAHGWPKTRSIDWCCDWIADTRPSQGPTKAKSSQDEMYRVGVNYVFVARYPHLAATWLEAALCKLDTAPQPLQAILADPLGNITTELFPDWRENGEVCCEAMLVWAEALPSPSNDDEADLEEVGYLGVLMRCDDEELIAQSRAALESLPQEHPWRTRQTKAPASAESAPRRRQQKSVESASAQR